MSLALGGEYREEQASYRTDLVKARQALSAGLASSPAEVGGDRAIAAIALEAVFPVRKGIQFGAAVRYDDYSDFGSTINPKFTIRYAPVEQVLLRASYNTGFSAPSLTQLYSPQQLASIEGRNNDPVLCPGGQPVAGAVPGRDCAVQFLQLVGGNPNLSAEESEAYSVGIVLQPVSSLRISVDYFNYKVPGIIVGLPPQRLFDDPVTNSASFIRCSQAPEAARASIAACRNPGSVDPLAYVINTLVNAGETEISGYDFQADWRGPASTIGRFSVGMRGTYIESYKFQIEPGTPFFNPLGQWTAFSFPVLRLQTITNFGWERGSWSGNLQWQYLSGYIDQNPSIPPSSPFFNKVDAASIFDLSVVWQALTNLRLRFGVLNLFDQDPPFSNQLQQFQARGYDDFYYSPRGRTYTFGVSYQFR